MSVLVQRFFKSRWSIERHVIDDMQVGEVVKFKAANINNVKTSISRTKEAYDDGRDYQATYQTGAIWVKRIK